MLSFLHFPCALTLSHKSRTLTYTVYTPNEIYARFIAFYRNYCDGSGGEYRIVAAPTDSTDEYEFTLRLPEHIPGAHITTHREFFDILCRQYAPVEPALPGQLGADSWEDLL